MPEEKEQSEQSERESMIALRIHVEFIRLTDVFAYMPAPFTKQWKIVGSEGLKRHLRELGDADVDVNSSMGPPPGADGPDGTLIDESGENDDYLSAMLSLATTVRAKGGAVLIHPGEYEDDAASIVFLDPDLATLYRRCRKIAEEALLSDDDDRSV